MTMTSATAPHGVDDTWFVIDEMAAVPAARRAATAMATELGFDAERVGEVGIVVSELATNVVRHAAGGEIVLRASHVGRGEGGGVASLRVLAIDAGPGSRNIAALVSDGASTRGTLGIGLGACVRLSTTFDVYSVPALGTVVEATLASRADAEPQADTLAELTRPLSADSPCGDTTAHRSSDGSVLAMLADGLGHGPLAAEASRRAAQVLRASDSLSPARLLEQIHAELGSTRGAAIAVIRYDASAGAILHAGVGNVAVRLLGPGPVRTISSQPGIVGHRIPRLRELSYPVPDATFAVMHSDGLTQRWTLDDVPGVLRHRPGVVCGAVMRAAASGRDDASVLVLRTAA